MYSHHIIIMEEDKNFPDEYFQQSNHTSDQNLQMEAPYQESQENAPDQAVEEPSGGIELVRFPLVFKGQTHQMEVDLDMPVQDFRNIVFEKTGIPPALQKLMGKGGRLEDGQTLREAKMKDRCKVLLVGSTVAEVVAVNRRPEENASTEEKVAAKEPLCQQKIHSKIIEKGKPEDATEALPPFPITGMRNKQNSRVRLTFKLELDQLWIGTPERTEKIPMSRISGIINEPIVGYEDYHIMGFEVGTTEASRIWIYWVPAQFVQAIKRTVLG